MRSQTPPNTTCLIRFLLTVFYPRLHPQRQLLPDRELHRDHPSENRDRFSGLLLSCVPNLFSMRRVMNAPDRYERFVVPEGTKKVSYERDTKIINAASFTIEREDHTIGNIVRMQLHRDGNVLFAGYKLPHPLQYKIIVRVHTTSQSSPMQAYNQAINDLDKELDHLKAAFEAEVARVSGEY
ncbi:hypothetical protein L6452_18159 [Arctium lappa]|uniref:Uncharacterized protein n=1 Tax=Arctium lappa TaxID=4217 RepID=A0ACB9C5C6_ARCLA|nr:hypothetical protein L6452_18159 [Arctium lappa]